MSKINLIKLSGTAVMVSVTRRWFQGTLCSIPTLLPFMQYQWRGTIPVQNYQLRKEMGGQDITTSLLNFPESSGYVVNMANVTSMNGWGDGMGVVGGYPGYLWEFSIQSPLDGMLGHSFQQEDFNPNMNSFSIMGGFISMTFMPYHRRVMEWMMRNNPTLMELQCEHLNQWNHHYWPV